MKLPSLLVLVLVAYGCAGNPPFRLPRNVFPTTYTIEIITNLGTNGNFTFDGRIWIQVQCNTSTSSVKLHMKDLEIFEENVKVLSKDHKLINVTSHEYVPEYDFYVMNLEEPLEAGEQYVLFIPYRGQLTEGLVGYYRSRYEDRSTGETRWLAVTQFESTDARRALPCFDEPSFKAKFKVSLGRPKHLSSCSNMPLIKTEEIEGMPNWEWDRFAQSEIMSTYLVAFMVSDFKYRISEPIPGTNVTFRIWARPDALQQTEFAGQVGPQVLHFYEQFFDVKYPLPKQDMVAIPDFSSGAMENWGLITYRETALLYAPNVTSDASKQSIATVISHELAHQWFGNLVTMKWWTDLWLNEGFATYVSALGVNKVHPEWNSLDAEHVESVLTVFTFDALQSSHPVSITIENPNHIGQIFDSISYKKGSYLLRMMSLFLGQEVFRMGVSNYLKAHRFSNAEQDDLWQSLTEEAHRVGVLPRDMNVKMIMDTWTLQTGYPVITVTRDYEEGTAIINQRRFLSHTDAEEKQKSCWIAPLSYTSQSEADFNTTVPKAWTSCDHDTKITDMPGKDQWLILNIKITGLYRVHYDDQNWALISDALNSDQFSSIGLLNRVQLVDDALALAWTGEIQYLTALNILNYLQQEIEYLPWKAAFSNINVLNRLMRRTIGYGSFRDYVRKLLAPLYKNIDDISNLPKTMDLQKVRHHNLIVTWACRLQMGECLEQARTLFKTWMETKDPDTENPIPRDLRSLVYCTALKYGGENEWKFAWQRYLNSNVGTEKIILLSQLGCTREPWLLRRYLEWILNEESGIRRQDSWIVFKSIAGNEVGFQLAKEFFIQRITHLHKYYGPKASQVSRYITVLANQMYREDELKEFMDFMNTNEKYLKLSAFTVKQALESVRINIQWHKKHYETFVTTLMNYATQ
ncbi:aminopeptidase N-like isoform X2 [Periplaneta americana]